MRRRNQIPLWLAVVVIGAVAGKPVLAETIAGRVHWAGAGAALSNFVIWVDDIDGSFPAPAEHAVVNQKDLRFDPHVLAIAVGTAVEFPNADPVSHNVFSISDAKRFNLGLYGPGLIRRLIFDKPGVVELLCNVHLEMGGYIVVIQNPHFAKTAADGSYRISGVPAGRHRLRCWHERVRIQEHVVDVPDSGVATVDFFIQA